MRTEELIEIENAGRRCAVCRSGRGWRRFELVRPAGREPIVLCGSCRARFGDDPPVGRKPAPALRAVPAPAEPLAPPRRHPDRRGIEQRPDRLRAALRDLPGSFSTAMAARAAGLTATRRSRGYRTWSAAARSGASASAGRLRRHRATSLRRWIAFRRERATFGSSGNGRASADEPPAARVDCRRPGGPAASGRERRANGLEGAEAAPWRRLTPIQSSAWGSVVFTRASASVR